MSADKKAVVENEGRDSTSPTKRSLRPHEQLIGLIILAAAFIVGSLLVASGVRSHYQPQGSNQITITGSAEQSVTSNSFEWTANVASTQSTTSAALTQLNGWTAQIRRALLAAGALREMGLGSFLFSLLNGEGVDIGSIHLKARAHPR